MQEIWAIPDIHGRFDLLNKLWPMLEKESAPDRKVVFLGDMIDRGPESMRVVDFIKIMCERFPDNFVALRGNHETLAINATPYGQFAPQYDDQYLWHINGGNHTTASYGDNYTALRAHILWFQALPLFHVEQGFFFSHAPVPRERLRNGWNKGKPFTEEELTWTYSPDEFGIARNFKSDDGLDQIGVCGHITALRKGIREPRLYEHYIFADAGCGCSDKAPLVAIEVRSRKILYAHPDTLRV